MERCSKANPKAGKRLARRQTESGRNLACAPIRSNRKVTLMSSNSSIRGAERRDLTDHRAKMVRAIAELHSFPTIKLLLSLGVQRSRARGPST
jgi:hypothetical protein